MRIVAILLILISVAGLLLDLTNYVPILAPYPFSNIAWIGIGAVGLVLLILTRRPRD